MSTRNLLISTSFAALLAMSGFAAAQTTSPSSPSMDQPSSTQSPTGGQTKPSADQLNKSPDSTTKSSPRAQTKDQPNGTKSAQQPDKMAPNQRTTQQPSGTLNAQTPDRKSTTRSSETQTKSKTAVKLTSQQRTKIFATVKKSNAPRLSRTEINFNIHVGTRVPSRVHLVALPAPVVEIYPDWSGFLYFMVGDQIVVVDPGTHEIVAVITA